VSPRTRYRLGIVRDAVFGSLVIFWFIVAASIGFGPR